MALKPRDIVLTHLPQADGGRQIRPALILATLPGRFNDLLVCGVSSQLNQMIGNWDEAIGPEQPAFKDTGLRVASVIRLSHLAVANAGNIEGAIGQLDDATYERLVNRLAKHLLGHIKR